MKKIDRELCVWTHNALLEMNVLIRGRERLRHRIFSSLNNAIKTIFSIRKEKESINIITNVVFIEFYDLMANSGCDLRGLTCDAID
jgi:hypothetical protein